MNEQLEKGQARSLKNKPVADQADTQVFVEVVSMPVTPEMSHNYRMFWQLVLGRLLQRRPSDL